ncbi:cell division protein ZipA C-terminal FtsZ-binding domain-containing protein [Thiothrix eikelboomii]|uniref:cell division protein ZipA C-terminal FtsZ-binding domain-containing protein n=1 Tax=Thiothrix eikelboomii TaxID=92487 RepID=UPI003BB19611
MEIVSLIIMIIGLVALIFIYWASRRTGQDFTQQRQNRPSIDQITAEDGSEISSIAADLPASDGKLPNENARTILDGWETKPGPPTPPDPEPETTAELPSQLIMFIAAEQAEFAGTEVLSALDNAGLQFGEMNVYHRMILTETGEQSLFYVANGIKPWTLVPDEVAETSTPGLSLILNLPSPINNREAIHDFVKTAERLNHQLDGVIKNQNQEVISEEELRAYFAMI